MRSLIVCLFTRWFFLYEIHTAPGTFAWFITRYISVHGAGINTHYFHFHFLFFGKCKACAAFGTFARFIADNISMQRASVLVFCCNFNFCCYQFHSAFGAPAAFVKHYFRVHAAGIYCFHYRILHGLHKRIFLLGKRSNRGCKYNQQYKKFFHCK